MSVEKKEVDFHLKRKSIVDKVLEHVCTPRYQPTNKQWEVTFKTLGWDRNTIEDFWAVFCRINKSKSGEITLFEFLNYFNLDRSGYVEHCFNYFDTTGGDTVDFLEFMVSVWNLCTMKVDTLTSFTFDIYDLDSDGQLSLPEIERMVLELYGTNKILSKIGNEVLQDVNQFAEERGGILDLTSFTIYTMNHSLLLFPVFGIQRTIQKKVMGLKYWNNVENFRRSNVNQKKEFTPRHVQILLRTYKTGAAAAFLTHTGDPNVALREHFMRDIEDGKEIDRTKESSKNDVAESPGERRETYKYEKLKTAIEKIQEVKAAKSCAIKENAQSIRRKTGVTVDLATKAFLEAGRRAKSSYSKSRLSKISAKMSNFVNDMHERLNEIEYNAAMPSQNYQTFPSQETHNIDNTDEDNLTEMQEQRISAFKPKINEVTKQYVGRTKKKKKLRPRSAREGDVPKRRNAAVTIDSSTKYDHRRDQFKQGLRPRTPGALVYTIDKDGGYNRMEMKGLDSSQIYNTSVLSTDS